MAGRLLSPFFPRVPPPAACRTGSQGNDAKPCTIQACSSQMWGCQAPKPAEPQLSWPKKKRRYGIQLRCQLEFSASLVASLWEGTAALQLCSEASAHLEPHPRFVSIFFFPLPSRQREACWSGDSHSPAPLRPILPIKESWFCRNRLIFCAQVGVS